MKKKPIILRDNHITWLECILIVAFSLFPVFLHFPFHLNSYLSWDGAYRLYLGQVPYRDFGLPMGFGYWIIPAIFFKIFGPYMITLVKAQAFVNILSAFAFRSILKSVDVKSPIRLLCIFLFLISFSFINFWPWYNQTVIVFELIGLAFLFKYIVKGKQKFGLVYLLFAAFFTFLSFFTKQDAGAFAFLIALSLIICHAIYERKITPVVWFLVFYLLIALCIVAPFIPYHIGYWFNYGQPPHYDRISFYDIFDIFLGQSGWIKFYLLAIVLILILKLRHFKKIIQNKNFVIFSLLVLGILGEASVFQVTSYMPDDNNIFFHSFAIAYIFSFSGLTEYIDFRKWVPLCLTGIFILLWWSPRPWVYGNMILKRFYPHVGQVDTNEVSIRTYVRQEPGTDWFTAQYPDRSKWKRTPWKPFEKISMPQPTINGIKELLEMPIVKDSGNNLRVLNMSELTPLAEIIGYTPETGPDIPLWYHKNVGMYERQIREYETKIKNNYYDLVLFEYIPMLNNFYPFEIRDTLKRYYHQVESFPGPRSIGYSVIEVYLKGSNP
jgi:hypothetical protein